MEYLDSFMKSRSLQTENANHDDIQRGLDERKDNVSETARNDIGYGPA